MVRCVFGCLMLCCVAFAVHAQDSESMDSSSLVAMEESVTSVEGSGSSDEEKLLKKLEEQFFAEELLAEEEEAQLAEEEEADEEAAEEELEQIFAEEYGYAEDIGPYRLRIGDRMFVSIYGEPNTGRAVVVDSTGAINYLLVGRVFVLGMTIDELRYHLDEKIKKYFKHAFVAISPVEFGSQYYTILGEVRSPGKKVLYGSTSLLTAICQAGGFTEGAFRTQTIELADLSHAFLARKGDYIPVDFRKLIYDGDISEDKELLNGDYIFIPNSLYKEIHILGEVKDPTTIGFINTVSLVEAIAQARGLTDRASSRICVIRGSLANPTKFMIDINLILRGFEKDFLLQPGDIVYAPPRTFTSLRDIVRLGIRAFVSTAASTAGVRAWEAVGFDGEPREINPSVVVPFSE